MTMPTQTAVAAGGRDDEARWLTAQLARVDLDFHGAYLLAGRLRDFVRERPDRIDGNMVRGMIRVLDCGAHEDQTQALHYYGVLARSLAETARAEEDFPRLPEDPVLEALTRIAVEGDGVRQRAASEALGGLPVKLPRVPTPAAASPRIPKIDWPELARCAGVDARGAPRWLGRSLVAPLASGPGFLVVKLARTADSLASLAGEAEWMARLKADKDRFSVSCGLPRPLRVKGGFAFRMHRIPSAAGPSPEPVPDRPPGIAFTAPPGYFDYPNDPRRPLSDPEFSRVLLRSARLLGELTGSGIVHTAPIPLFHNRMQQRRREDAGIYHWWRGGRLDRWLQSCRHPNFGLSGLRDFEHLAPAPAGRDLYRAVGGQLLSLILVAGSHFRHRDSDRLGIDANGAPADTRDLFDPALFARLICGAGEAFYRGFAGPAAPAPVFRDVAALAGRLVEAMGVDRHMGEILRTADQLRMDDALFAEFLAACGRSPAQIRTTPRGAADIHLHTGPHLGGFNDRISVPELIDFLSAASAACIAGRFQAEKRLRSADPSRRCPAGDDLR